MTGVGLQSCQNLCSSPGDWQLGITTRWIMTKKSDVSGKLELVRYGSANKDLDRKA